MRILDVPQGSDEWHAARLGLATASNFSDILAEARSKGQESASRRNYRLKLVLERLTGRKGPSFESFATRQGTEREPAARLAYEVETGDVVDQRGFVLHDVLEAGASPDGLIGDDGGLEIKSPEPSAHLQALRTARVPPEYVAQVQGNLWLCQRRWWRFVSWNPDFPEHLQLVTVHVPRDQAYIDRLASEVTVFLDEVRAELAELRAMPGRMST
jgi:hypothetical protein